MSLLWRLERAVAMPILRVLLRISTQGKEHVPREGPAILASNHLSFLDHVVLPALTPRHIVYISKVEHFDKTWKRWMLGQWGVIPLRRGAGDQEAFEKAKQAIGEGKLFAIYPEGTRSLDGRLHKGHTGVARLALATGVPVVPVAMKGTFEAWPKGGRLRLFRRTAAVAGAPLQWPELLGKQDDREACRQVTDEIMAQIAELSGQEYEDVYQRNPEVPTRATVPARR